MTPEEAINDQYQQALDEQVRFFRSVELVDKARESRWPKADVDDLKIFLGIESYFRGEQ